MSKQSKQSKQLTPESGRLRTLAICGGMLLLSASLLADAAGQGTVGISEGGTRTRSPVRAAALSLVLPGLGQHYVNGGTWKGSATLFALADVASWVMLFRTTGARDQRINSYRALAAAGADADVDGKDRSFFLNLATYRSSDDYLDAQLRNRAWDQLDYVSSIDFQWEWTTEADFLRFRDLRDDAETLDRRVSVLVATLVANRIVSAIVALRAARRANQLPRATLSLSPPSAAATLPQLHVSIRL